VTSDLVNLNTSMGRGEVGGAGIEGRREGLNWVTWCLHIILFLVLLIIYKFRSKISSFSTLSVVKTVYKQFLKRSSPLQKLYAICYLHISKNYVRSVPSIETLLDTVSDRRPTLGFFNDVCC